MNKPKAYSYIRWSSEKQTKGSSLERQLKAAREVAESKDLELVEMLDAGVSSFRGKNIEHGALGDFIDAVQGGAIAKGSYLILEAWDRATRQDLLTANELLSSLLRLDIIIYTTMDDREYSKEIIANNPFMLMQSLMELFRGHDESKKKSDRTNESAIVAINNFNNGLRSPDGYALAIKAVGSHPWMFDTSETVLVGGKAYSTVKEHPVFFPIAKDIVSKILSGMGSYKIKEYLDSTYKPPKQRANKKRAGWSISLIRQFHTRDYIRGIKSIKVKDYEYTLDGYYPRLIDDETFFKLQNARTKNRITSSSRSYVGLISGIRVAKCGHCSDSISFFTNRRGDKSTLRYICTNKQVSTKNCESRSYSAQLIEDTLIRLSIGKIWKADAEIGSKTNVELEAQKAKLADIESRQEKLSNNFTLFESPPPAMVKQMNTLTTEFSDTSFRIKELEGESVNTSIVVSDIEKQWAGIPPTALIKENDELRTKVRMLVRNYVDNIYLYKVEGGERAGFEMHIHFKDGHVSKAKRNASKLTLLSQLSERPHDDILSDDEVNQEYGFIDNKLQNMLFWNMTEDNEPLEGAPKMIDNYAGMVMHPPKLAQQWLDKLAS